MSVLRSYKIGRLVEGAEPPMARSSIFAFVAFSDGKPDSTFPENALIQHPDDRPDEAGRQGARDDRLEAERDYVGTPLRRHGGQAGDHDADAAEIGEAAHREEHD